VNILPEHAFVMIAREILGVMFASDIAASFNARSALFFLAFRNILSGRW
jgi:hypothetical protein